ncbi:NmrA family transcriptional regulator [Caulobacter flavus]|uniref:NmrA family transcriptional regulator n=1 Tax=Caulobacter flavus TaxID=1679497 RepID=A0A2N5CKI4_9CAUL|nr:NAD(P)H-binding protein [Caulobacter flavus]AYV49613.1 NmrA family transcriptional regulator [Caulobacter flavus]PLR05856.1 NmrA family transcriptional regulator [Caulobacter flavus]
MNIVVAGGTGCVGSKLVEILRRQGHEARVAARTAGVDVLTRQGLDEVMVGADVVVDVLNSPSFDDAPAMAFFETSSRNILEAAAAEGVKHYLALSIVGCERLQASGYFRAKLAQERLIREAGVPYSILRSTQFFEFLDRVVEDSLDGDVVRLAPARVQFIAAGDVAAALADITGRAPANDTIEVAGPDPFRLDDLVRRFLAARQDGRAVVADPQALYFGAPLTDETLIAGSIPRFGHTEFDNWIRRLAKIPA